MNLKQSRILLALGSNTLRELFRREGKKDGYLIKVTFKIVCSKDNIICKTILESVRLYIFNHLKLLLMNHYV